MSTFAKALADIASPDPDVREPSLGAFWKGFTNATAEERMSVGAELVARVEDGPTWQRSFAVVALAYLPGYGIWDDAWTTPVLDWWANETDLRGYDQQIGWIHAVAHGADLIGELGRHGLVPVQSLVDAIMRRMLNPCPGIWCAQEDDRLAVAWAQVYAHPQTTQSDVRAHGAHLRDLIKEAKGVVPLPDRLINTTHTVGRLYVVADGPIPSVGHQLSLRDVVTQEARSTLEFIQPWSKES